MICDGCGKPITEDRHIPHAIFGGTEFVYYHNDKKCAPREWWSTIDEDWKKDEFKAWWRDEK